MPSSSWKRIASKTPGNDGKRSSRRAARCVPSVRFLEDRTLLSTASFVRPLGTAAQAGTLKTSIDLTTTAAADAGHSIILELAMRPNAGPLSAYAHAPGSTARLFDFRLDAEKSDVGSDLSMTGGVPGSIRTALFSAIGTPALPAGTIFTIITPATDAQAVSAAEFRGLSAVNTFDVSAKAVGDSLAVSSGLSPVTHQAGELLIGAVCVAGTISGLTPNDTTHNLGFTAGAGYQVWPGAYPAAGGSPAKVAIHPEYRFVSSIGNYAADGSLLSTASGPWAAVLGTYRVDTADHFAITAPASISSGRPFTVTVTAQDASNQLDPGYVGTVRFSTTDPMGAILEKVTFTAADQGVKQIPVTLFSDGLRKIVAVDAEGSTTIAGSTAVLVHADHLDVTAPSTAVPGAPFTTVVTARRYDGTIDTSYIGPIHFTSNDSKAVLPLDSFFTIGTGKGTFTVVLKTPGLRTITATDTTDPTITGTASVLVNAAATYFDVSAPATSVAGRGVIYTVTARDANGNVAADYTGTVHFTSSDGQAVFAADTKLIAGRRTFAARLKTAGNQTITATDTVTASITGTSGIIVVTAAAATRFSVTLPPTVASDATFQFVVTALDEFGNIDFNYTGTVRFTSSDDTSPVLPSNFKFTAGMGSRTFSAKLQKLKTQTITATDTVIASITGTGSADVRTSP